MTSMSLGIGLNQAPALPPVLPLLLDATESVVAGTNIDATGSGEWSFNGELLELVTSGGILGDRVGSTGEGQLRLGTSGLTFQFYWWTGSAFQVITSSAHGLSTGERFDLTVRRGNTEGAGSVYLVTFTLNGTELSQHAGTGQAVVAASTEFISVGYPALGIDLNVYTASVIPDVGSGLAFSGQTGEFSSV